MTGEGLPAAGLRTRRRGGRSARGLPGSGSAPAGRSGHRRWSLSLVIGVVLLAALVALAVVSFLWEPYDPIAMDPSERLADPSVAHWLGTDKFGRDVFSQILHGSRTTLFVGVVAVGVAAVVGVPMGLVAGVTRRRWIDHLLMRGTDLVLAFPALLVAIMFSAVFGASTLTAMLAIGIATAPAFARVVRAGALQVMSRDFILAARAAGLSQTSVTIRHVLPNVAGLVIVQASVSFGIAVLAEAALSFLGFGTPAPVPSWGRMLQESQELLHLAPRLAVVPGTAIALAVLAFNLLGDGLRDLLDPRLGRVT